MEKTWVKRDAIQLVGVSERTSNAAEMDAESAKIAPTIGRYFSDALYKQIPSQIEPGVTYSVYTDFADEDRGEYTYFVGAAVASTDDVPEGFSTLTIPAQDYVVFAIGPDLMPESCIQAWQAIWQMTAQDFGGKRRFDADFERYDHRAQDLKQACFDIYLGLEKIAVFKAEWEQDQRALSTSNIEAIIHARFPNQATLPYEVMTSGCANLNIKLLPEFSKDPLMLRVYCRDSEVADKEQRIGAMLSNVLPVPETMGVFEVLGYTVAEVKYLSGTILRDVLLDEMPEAEMRDLLFKVGQALAQLHSFSWDQDQPLVDWQSFCENTLADEVVQTLLPSKMHASLLDVLERFAVYFPDAKAHHLVHGDFDPANILVDRVHGVWQISGILDWEFAHSGSTLLDVANALRYAHLMPVYYEESFVQGLSAGGYVLPQHWRKSIGMLNVCALLDCLRRSDPVKTPKRIEDILRLLTHACQAMSIEDKK